MIPPPPRPTLFPYTTLFRSSEEHPHRVSGNAHFAPEAAEFAAGQEPTADQQERSVQDRKSTRLNSSHGSISYAVFCLKKKKVVHDHEKSERKADNTS